MKFSLQTNRSVYLALLFFGCASILVAGLTQQTWRASAAAILGQPPQDAPAVIWQDQGVLQRSKETPGAARAFRLSPTALTAVLNRAPREFRAPLKTSQVELTLPLPSGALARFQIEESPMLDPDLAARLPEVKTYRGQGLDDPSATVRFDWTPQGFHALILSASGDFLIEPATAGDTLNYVSQNMQTQRDDILVSCGVTEADVAEATARGVYGSGNRPQAPAFSNGSTLRIYRMAVAASGEYAALYGSNNVATTQTVITSVINLVNAIYEKEMAVRFTLVNNTNIIFTNAATDPYSSGANGNSASSATLTANQTTLDTVALLGSANYDIGHLFGGITGLPGGSASFSGLAQLGVVCVTGAKARGVSTMGGFTATSSFFIPGIAHEIGHQFSARHTFNGTLGNCGGGNRDSNSAYESGSGITIMSYAGNCGNDNLTSNTSTDVRFHSKSFEQMLNFMTGTATCNTTSATGNTPPTVNAGADFTIPKNTPFTLTATASDPDAADAGAVRYSWEQIDSGGSTFSQNGTEASYNDAADPGTTTRPIFRPFARNTSLSRTFPSLTYILNNANDPPQFNGAFETAEELPRIGRTLNFRFTAHDNRANGGGITDDSVVITVNGATGPFLVTAPNTNVSWTGNTSQTVTWSLNGTNALAANVKISLSTDGGNTFPTTLLASTPNDGSESITVPNINTTTARIKVEAVGNIFFDISNANFTITPGSANTAPTFTPAAAISRQQGSAAGAAVTVGTVADAQTAAGSLTVTQIAGGTATGITVTGITNTNGTIAAQVSASCTATTGTVRFQVFDGSLTGTGDLTVNVTTNTAPVLSYSSPQAVSVAGSLTVNPATGPSDNGSLASIVLQSQGTYTGTISVNNSTGVVSISNAAPIGSHTITVRATDNCGTQTNATFTLNVNNTAPTFTPAATLSRQQGSAAGAAVTIGTVADATTSAGSLTVTQIAGGTATGITVTGITNTNGTITAQVSAGCTATSGTVRFQVSDSSLTGTGDLQVNVTSNALPTLTYANANVTTGGAATVNPATGPLDNGTISTIVVQSQGTYTGTISVNNSTGVVSISNAAPAGNHTITIRATDNCGAQTNASFTLSVGAACPTITVNPSNPTLPVGRAGMAYSQTFTQMGGAGTVNFSISAGVLPTGLTLSAAGGLSGTPSVFGPFSFTVRATDANNCLGERAYSLTINPPCTTITVNPTTLPNSTVGTGYNQTLTATGGTAPYTFAVTAGSLPNGLSLASGGALTGTPTTTGTFNFTVTATDNTGCTGTRSYTVNITTTGSSGLMFYPLAAPVRLLDTRPGTSPNACSQPNAPIAGQTSRTQPGRNLCTIPANAQALTGNVTTVNSGGGFLTLYPSDATQPTVASTNYGVNEVINNVFTVGLGADGAFKIFANTTTDVVVDVTGYYAPPGASGLYFHPLPVPVRLMETRAGFIGCVRPGAPLIGNTESTQQAISACTGIPAAARAIVGNATTVGPQGVGFLTLFPADATRPLVASSNFNTGQVVNGPFSVGLAANGQFKIYTTATTDLVVDVLGYYSPEANDANGPGLLFNPLPKPVRLLETRPGQPVGCFKPGTPLAGDKEIAQPARGVCDGITIPATALGVVGNATVVQPAGVGFLTLWPSTEARPLVATLNYNAGDVGNRHFIVGLGNADGAFNIYSLVTTHLVIDLSGYFAP